MLLSDEEIENLMRGRSTLDFGKALQAAILAKLASAELPEPTVYSYNARTHMNVLDAYTADQLRQAYAQGAAAQLAEKPSAWKCPSCGVVQGKRPFDGYCRNCTSFD